MAQFLDLAGLAIYTALGLTALIGLFVTVLLVRRVAQKRFSNNKQGDEFLDDCAGPRRAAGLRGRH